MTSAHRGLAWRAVPSQVGRWVKELRKIVGPDIAIVIAGNKCDLEKQRNVDHEEAVKCVVPVTGSALLCAVWCSHVDCGLWMWVCRYAESVGAQHFLTSAKQNKNLDKVFVELTKRTSCARHGNAPCQWGCAPWLLAAHSHRVRPASTSRLSRVLAVNWVDCRDVQAC